MGRFVWIFLGLIGISFCAKAQNGILKGKVIDDSSNQPVEGTEMVAKKDGNPDSGTITGANGQYQLRLPADTYNMVFQDVRYGRKVYKNVVVKADSVTIKNTRLDAASKTLDIVAYKEAKTSHNMQVNGSRVPSVAPLHQPEKSIPQGYNRNFNREGYDRISANPFKTVRRSPLSTFSVDVDNAAYANARRFLTDHTMPPKDAIRIEEFINYFNYDYPQPSGQHPFSINRELGSCPWNKDHKLLHIGLQGKQIKKAAIPRSNLVFLVDVSGSMESPNKLPLLKKSLKLLVKQLRQQDKITMVVYAGAAGLVLPPTSGANKAAIMQAIEDLEAGGSTAGSKGIKLAYEKARENFLEDGNNRVILATDGDFNVGVTSDGGLTRLIEKKREEGIFLSVLGFGKGNYQGSKMEKLSNKGNGNYSYIDNILEAKKTLVREFGATMQTIAKDVKLQLEFNPVKVQAYRLIGYVNRQLANADFNKDSVDAGEIGAGHTVTALYEIIPNDKHEQTQSAKGDALKYQEKRIKPVAEAANEIGLVKFRYKEPKSGSSKLIQKPLPDEVTTGPSNNYYWSSAVAMFGMELRGSPYKGKTNYKLIRQMANKGKGADEKGFRSGFIRLVEKAETIQETEAEK